MAIKRVLIFSEFDTSGGTREFLKQLILINNNLNFKSYVVSENIDFEMIDFFNEHKVEFSNIKRRSRIFKKPYFSLVYEFIYHRYFVNKVKHDIIVSSVGTPGINFFHFLTKSRYLYILHSAPSKPGIKSILHFLIPFLFQGGNNKFYVVSNYLKTTLSIQWKINLKNIKVIYNSYKFNNSKINVSKSSILTLTTIGHLTNYRNPEIWLEMAIYFSLKYNNLKFVWVGEGPLFETLKNRVPKNLNINFVGNSNDVEKYYLECDIYLNFSDLESLGMAVVDAISYGIPCVVSKVGGLVEIINHGVNGYTFSNFNEARIYIDNLICDSDLRTKMGLHSINFTKEIFSPENQLNKIDYLYNEMLNI